MTRSTFKNRISLFRMLKWTVGSMIVLSMGFMLFFDVLSVLSLATLENHYAHVLIFTHDHYALTVMLYIGLYCFLAALSLPGKLMLTLAAGHLFGTVLGTVYILWGASAGAALAFLGTRYLFREVVQHTLNQRMPGFQKPMKFNSFSALLVLRLLPIVPYSLLNLLAGLTPMKFNTFLGATLVGIFPVSLFLSYTGSQLPNVFLASNWGATSLVLSVAALAVLALIPLGCLYCASEGRHVEAEAAFVCGSRPSQVSHSQSIFTHT